MEAVGTIKAVEMKPAEAVFTLNAGGMGKNRETAPEATLKQDQKPKDPLRNVKEEDSRTKIERIAEAMDNYVKSIERDIDIQVHEATGNIIVKVISGEDGKVLREIPPEEMLNLAAKMEEMTGLLFNENV